MGTPSPPTGMAAISAEAGHEGGEDGDQAKVGGIPAAPAPLGRWLWWDGRSGVMVFLSDVLANIGLVILTCTVAAGRVFCRRPTNRRPGCWRAPPMTTASRPDQDRTGAWLLPYGPMSGRRGRAGRLVEAVLSPALPRPRPDFTRCAAAFPVVKGLSCIDYRPGSRTARRRPPPHGPGELPDRQGRQDRPRRP